MHPLLASGRKAFLKRAARNQKRLAVLDVPLLFETGGDVACDGVAVVSAPRFVQRQRVLKRQGMTEERLQDILARQMSDRDKRRYGDFVIPTGLDKGFALHRIREIVRLVKTRRAHVWPNGRKAPRRLATLKG